MASAAITAVAASSKAGGVTSSLSAAASRHDYSVGHGAPSRAYIRRTSASITRTTLTVVLLTATGTTIKAAADPRGFSSDENR